MKALLLSFSQRFHTNFLEIYDNEGHNYGRVKELFDAFYENRCGKVLTGDAHPTKTIQMEVDSLNVVPKSLDSIGTKSHYSILLFMQSVQSDFHAIIDETFKYFRLTRWLISITKSDNIEVFLTYRVFSFEWLIMTLSKSVRFIITLSVCYEL